MIVLRSNRPRHTIGGAQQAKEAFQERDEKAKECYRLQAKIERYERRSKQARESDWFDGPRCFEFNVTIRFNLNDLNV